MADYDEEDDDHKRLAEEAGVGEEGSTTGAGLGAYPPDEELDTRPVVPCGPTDMKSMILLKVPDFVIEQWSHVKERGVELGRIRIYDPLPGENKQEQEYLFRFPPPSTASASTSQDAAGQAPESLTFTQTPITGVEGRASRKFLMREKERVYDFSGKSRQEGEPRIFAPVATELLLTPKDTDRDRSLYNKLVQNESERAEAAKRKTRVLSAAEQRDLRRSAAAIRPGVKSTLLSGRPAKRDNYVRTDKSVLIDTMLQSCFKEYRYWSLKGMSERLQQPVEFVRETLKEVAEYQATGPYHGYWCLQSRFQKQSPSAGPSRASTPAPAELAPDDVKPTQEQIADLERRQREADLAKDDFSAEEEDDDDEMEEVEV